MAETLTFEVVSPERLLFSKPVAMVTVPGTEGDFGVLPNHAPVVAAVRPGVIDVFENDNQLTERLFVAGGFAEVTGEGCTVLAEEAIPVSSLNRQQVEQDVANIQQDIGTAKTEAETQALEEALVVAKAKLEALAA